jgi:hypothetical protein
MWNQYEKKTNMTLVGDEFQIILVLKDYMCLAFGNEQRNN